MASGLTPALENTAFAFRGYNVTNLGRTPELLERDDYGPVIRRWLQRASELTSRIIKRSVDLETRVRDRQDSDADSYPEDLAQIVAVELAQIEILEQQFGIEYPQVDVVMGYSLGEISALIAGGVYSFEAAMTPLLELAVDAAEMGQDTRMGILFSRDKALQLDAVRRLCIEINQQNQGTVGISAVLSPNTVLLLGQRNTIREVRARIKDSLPGAHLKRNPHRWPPLHTALTRQRCIPDRASVMLDSAEGGLQAPEPAILSCVTGTEVYRELNSREIIPRWIDQPQLLWDVIDKLLGRGIETLVHIGPEPNIVPATLTRLANNITTQLSSGTLASLGLRAMSRIVRRRSWLTRLLTSDVALLRAPFVTQIVAEDWLLDQPAA